MSNYLLPNCVVLAAAVFGTRRAYFQAMEILPMARALEPKPTKTISSAQQVLLPEGRRPTPQRKTSGNRVGRPRQNQEEN
jgi:hypothetical protein